MSLTMSTAPVSAPNGQGNHPFFSLKNIVYAALAASIVSGGIAERDGIGEAMVGLMKSLKHVSFMGVELDFNETLIDSTVRRDVFEHLDGKTKADVAKVAGGLSGAQVVRLLNVGTLGKLCDFELATTQMNEDMATDIGLRDRKLVEMTKSEEDLRSVQADIRNNLAAVRARKAEPWSVGNPKFCYRVTLTDEGRNVRTALIYGFANGLARRG